MCLFSPLLRESRSAAFSFATSLDGGQVSFTEEGADFFLWDFHCLHPVDPGEVDLLVLPPEFRLHVGVESLAGQGQLSAGGRNLRILFAGLEDDSLFTQGGGMHPSGRAFPGGDDSDPSVLVLEDLDAIAVG